MPRLNQTTRRAPVGRVLRFITGVMILFAGFLFGPGGSVPALAQAPAGAWPEADSADVESVDSIIEALYEVISGPPGERDWDRMRSLHIPEARLIPTFRSPEGPEGAEGEVGYRAWSVDDYIEQAGAWLEDNGFFETEISRVTERFGTIAHAFSTYESRYTAEDAEPFQRGINSIQLLHDGQRWWIVTIFWYPETEASPIPARYQP